MALTLQQLQQNIDALEKQWAPKEDIQWYVDTLQVNAQWQYEPKGTAPAKPKSMADVYKSTLSKWIDTIKSWAKWYAETIQGLGTGAVRAVWSVSWVVWGALDLAAENNPLTLWANYLTGTKYKSDFGSSMKWMANKIAWGVEWVTQRNVWLNPESIPSKVGQFAWGAIATAPIGEWVFAWVSKVASPVTKLISKSWKALYKTAIKPNVDEASQIIKATAKGAKQPITRADTAFEYWVIGREKDIGVQWVREANKIFKDTISPAFKKAEEQGIKVKYSNLINEAKNTIKNSKVFSQTQKKEIIDNITSLGKNYKGNTTLSNLDLEKMAIVSKVPKKYIGAIKPPKELIAAQNALSDVFRDTVHSTLKNKFWINSAKLYKDYWNLIQLEKVGIKWLTEWGLRWGTGTALSTIYDALVTPIKTVWGKTLYKIGEWLQFTWPKWITSIKELLKKSGYKLVWDTIIKD